MKTAQTRLISYTEIRERQRTSPLRAVEIPVEHFVSLPLPTNRWSQPGYAFFASPVLRQPSQPVEQGAPDRWWVVNADSGKTLVYALFEVIPFAVGTNWETSTLPPVTVSLAELKAGQKNINELMDKLVPKFFNREEADKELRQTLLETLIVNISPPILPQYQALAPDFFEWLMA